MLGEKASPKDENGRWRKNTPMMNIYSSDLYGPCCFRADGVFCHRGKLHYSVAPYSTVMVEGEPVECPACNGDEVILTPSGKTLLEFIERFSKEPKHEKRNG
jgi:hypothetical protein